MNLLVSIIAAPLVAGLLCVFVSSRRTMELANVAAFLVSLGLGARLLNRIVATQVVTECNEFFRADALSVWMVLLISVVSLGTSLYAGHYFRRDLAAGAVTAWRVK